MAVLEFSRGLPSLRGVRHFHRTASPKNELTTALEAYRLNLHLIRRAGVLWQPHDINFLGISDDASQGDVVTIRIGTPVGVVWLMGEISIQGRLLIVSGLHMHSEGGPNAVGIRNLRLMARLVLERLDCDEARIEGAVRTTGANPNHRPRPIRIARDDRR